jgi:hypothetical protein
MAADDTIFTRGSLVLARPAGLILLNLLLLPPRGE